MSHKNDLRELFLELREFGEQVDAKLRYFEGRMASLAGIGEKKKAGPVLFESWDGKKSRVVVQQCREIVEDKK